MTISSEELSFRKDVEELTTLVNGHIPLFPEAVQIIIALAELCEKQNISVPKELGDRSIKFIQDVNAMSSKVEIFNSGELVH